MSDSEPIHPFAYWRALTDLGLVIAGIVFVGVYVLREPTDSSQARPVPLRKPATVVLAEPPNAPVSVSEPPPLAPPPAPKLDREAVARAEDLLDAASRDRARADHRAAVAARELERAETEAAQAALSWKSLGDRLRDPSTLVASMRARGAVLEAEVNKLKAEVGALVASPRPRRKPLIDKSPVARPTDESEFHFEVHHNRIAFIDLERLVDLVKTDARIKIRYSDGLRPISSTVGPVGAFSMYYELASALPSSLQGLLEGGSSSYNLRGWEIVPNRDFRGETIDAIQQPSSEFARAVNRLNPRTDTITLWVYPDSFPLYRQLRDLLHHRGFLVAARPLPEGMAIRGSPSGSLSAGQ